MKKLVLLMALVAFIGFSFAQTGPSTDLDISLKKTEPVPLQSSEYADLWLEVTNKGDTEARNVNLSFVESYPFSVDPGDQETWDLETLQPGEEYQVHLQVRVDENAVQGENELKFRTSTSSNIEITRKVPVEVRSDNSILAIKNTYLPDSIAPGKSGEMTLELENMADAQLKNIQVSLGTEGDLPLATSGASITNIKKIGEGEVTNVSFGLNADESVENGVFKLPVTLEYENEAGTAFKVESSTGVVIGGRPQLEAGLNNQDQLRLGTQSLNIRVVNRGFGSAEFVKLSVPEGENYRVLSPQEVYLGDMDADDFQTAEFEMHLDSQDVEVPVELSYISGSGEVSETQELKPDVYTQGELEEYGLSSGGSNLPIIVVVVVLLVGGGLYWRRRKNRD